MISRACGNPASSLAEAGSNCHWDFINWLLKQGNFTIVI